MRILSSNKRDRSICFSNKAAEKWENASKRRECEKYVKSHKRPLQYILGG